LRTVSWKQMAAEIKKEIELEIAHVLFMDIVGYSKLLINEQRGVARHAQSHRSRGGRIPPGGAGGTTTKDSDWRWDGVGILQ
jgi:hypothetical protein